MPSKSGSRSEPLKILCLDGGDSRCMSELGLLQEYMCRLELQMGKNTRPCEYFDLIMGVDAAGFIAALLVLFGMTVEEAQDEFCKIYNVVFAEEGSSPEQRSQRMTAAIQELMKREKYGIEETAKLTDVNFGGACKVAMCYTSAVQMGHCRIFRNYPCPDSVSQDVTVLEAVLGTWATPGLVSPVPVGPEGRQEEVVSAINGFCNPTQEIIMEAYKVFGAERNISCLLSLGSGKRGPIALETAKSDARQTLGTQIAVDCEAIDEQLQRRIGRLRVYYRFSVDSGLEGHRIFRGGFGAITSHSAAYCASEVVSSRLDDCLKAAEKAPGVTLERIHRSRIRGTSSSHGLPPLSAFFIARPKPMEALAQGLLEGSEFSQKIAVLSGMAGSGKTQLALKFARDYEDNFQHVLFIDASSANTIEKGLAARVRPISLRWDLNTVEEAMDILAEAGPEVTKDWLIIMDNADDISIDIPHYFPACNFGSILITTRNPAIGALAPGAHIKLDVMDPEEAVDALLASIFYSTLSTSNTSKTATSLQSTSTPTDRDREAARAIVDRLGYLPIAVIQAGCYIKQHHCLHEYLDRLEANRPQLLKRATRVHLDRLKYPHSVYAAFDVTLEVLSPHARQLLGVLSFLHYSNFPRPLFSIAAKSQFSHEAHDLLERGPEFQASIQFLSNILCPNGAWSEANLDDLLEELQQYSLIFLVPIHSMVTLRFHPLAHAWARDRMTIKEQDTHRAAAVRLLACGIVTETEPLWDYLSPHINALSNVLSYLHVNDRAAFSTIIRSDEKNELLLSLWRQIHSEVEAVYGTHHLRTSRAALQLADAIGQSGDWHTMEIMEQEVVATRESILGKYHLETAKAYENLARTFRGTGRNEQAEELGKRILRIRIKNRGIWHADTADGMVEIGTTFRAMSRLQEEQALLIGAIAIQDKVHGQSSVPVVKSLQRLAQCYIDQDELEEAENVQSRILKELQIRYGGGKLTAVTAMSWLSTRFHEQGRHKEAMQMRLEEVETRRQFQGNTLETMDALYWLGRAAYEQNLYNDAIKWWKEEVEGRRELAQGETTNSALGTISWIGRAMFENNQLDEALKYSTEATEGFLKDVGEEDIDYVNSCYWTGRIYFSKNEWKEAEDWFKKATDGYRIVRGERHQHTFLGSYWLGRAQFQLETYQVALETFKQTMEGQLETLGEINADTLNSIYWCGHCEFYQDHYTQAVEWWTRELEGRKLLHGLLHTETIATFYWLGRAAFSQEQWNKAEELCKQAADMYSEIGSGEATDCLDALFWAGKACYEQKRWKDAEAYWQKELEGRLKVHGELHLETLGTCQWISRTCLETGQYEEGEKWSLRALNGYRKIQDESTIEVYNTKYWFGRIYFEMGQDHYQEAERLMEEALAGYRDQKSDTSTTLFWLGKVAFAQKRYEEAEQRWKEEVEERERRTTKPDKLLARVLTHLARLYHTLGRQEEAKEAVDKALVIQREVLKADDPDLIQATELLKSIDEAPPNKTSIGGPMIEEPSSDPASAAQADADPVTAVQADAYTLLGDEEAAPDPGGDPTLAFELLNAPTSLSPPRPRSPFDLRSQFGRRPNSWSMF